jgi:3-hydroxy-9,10-secoandrosta-1,3,5(10)-triene-9,17-dione monooxygenase reductase component
MAAATSIDPAYFREVMAHIPTSVCVIAADHIDGPAGLSVGSFVSVSLDPPLVGVFVASTSTSWPRVEAAGSFCISVLAEDHEHVSRRFAISGGDKFAGLEWGRSPAGAPRLPGAVAWVDCELEATHPAGDHVLVLGRVLDLGAVPETDPLVFHRGGYSRLSNDYQRED